MALLTLFIVFRLLYIISCISYAFYVNYPVMYSLSERERVAVNMQGTVFTLARLKIVPTIKNLICRCLVYDCEICCSRELCSFEIQTGVSGCCIVIWRSSQELYVFTVFLTGARYNNLMPTT